MMILVSCFTEGKANGVGGIPKMQGRTQPIALP
jgi:hypothetical protein